MFFFLNGSKFCQKLIGTIIRMLVRHLLALSGIKKWQRPLGGEVSRQSPVCPPALDLITYSCGLCHKAQFCPTVAIQMLINHILKLEWKLYYLLSSREMDSHYILKARNENYIVMFRSISIDISGSSPNHRIFEDELWGNKPSSVKNELFWNELNK